MLPLFALLGASLFAGDIPVTDPALYFSPYNTDSDGAGAPLSNNIRTGSTHALWIYPGSYLKTTFTGTSVALRLDIRSMAGAMPKFRWRIDGAPFVSGQPAAGAAVLPLGDRLANAPHSLILYLAATDANYDRWQTPVQAVRILGLRLDGRAVAGSTPEAPKRAVFFGDSITEGAWNLGNSNKVADHRWPEWVAHSDATQAWPFHLAAALHAEYGAIGSGGMSWLRPSHSGIPPFPESWNFHYAGRRRSFTPAPDYVIVNMGTNDGAKNTAAVVEEWLRAVRRAIPRPAKILVLIPFGQQNRDSLTRAIAVANDPDVFKIDLGPAWAEGLARYGHPSPVSFDGLHPNAQSGKALAAAIVRAIPWSLEP